MPSTVLLLLQHVRLLTLPSFEFTLNTFRFSQQFSSATLSFTLRGVKTLSPKTEGRLEISHSKPVPDQDELLCVRVINSPHNGFSSWFTAQ